jgi:sarcosine oxidase subunit alpha
VSERLREHPVLGKAPFREPVRFTFNGKPVNAEQGDSIAAALLANGITAFRHSRLGEPRGLFCGIGHCYECRVKVDGVNGVRACLVSAVHGMRVEAEAEGRDGR